jgi:hypothetical protein
LKIGFISLWLTAIVYGLLINPSLSDSELRHTQMHKDMDALLSNGGVVVFEYENAKFGGTLLMRLISAASWTNEVKRKNLTSLSGMGWMEINSSNTFCKNGAATTINEHDTYKNESAVSINMTYSTASKSLCGSK